MNREILFICKPQSWIHIVLLIDIDIAAVRVVGIIMKSLSLVVARAVANVHEDTTVLNLTCFKETFRHPGYHTGQTPNNR